ncbi:MAG: WYL domain-containing protein [Erysipelotrichaceae bacterium]|nr:WYL domain-containing protein [Erysipelotrichaceae bacterium]
MERNNKKRMLYLLDILRKNSDTDKRISLGEITTLLEERGIAVSDRKTIYDDIRVLNECGFDIEYDKGYYLLEAPFSLSEVKIILDSLNSLRNLDEKMLQSISAKLNSFISDDEEKLLERLRYPIRHKNGKLLQRMEDILEAIKKRQGVFIRKKNGEKDLVFPLFIHRNNDHYYFYCHYENDPKLYHYRFDNIRDTVLSDRKDSLDIPRSAVIGTIEASSNSFYKGKKETLRIILTGHDEGLEQRFADDFPNAIRTADGFSIIVSVNEIFFSKIAAYGTGIKIADPEAGARYADYLKRITDLYFPEK